MKTLTIILATALTLQVGVLFAGNINERVPAARENVSYNRGTTVVPALQPSRKFQYDHLCNPLYPQPDGSRF